MEKKNETMQRIEENLTKGSAKIVEMKERLAEVHADIKAGYLTQLEKAVSLFK